jgi:hypothetical protein
MRRLQFGQVLLATTGAIAPFIGLLGTVWGIYHALTSIAGSGQISIERVAGPVGEALIMTAAGLAVAIPAVLAYNGSARHRRHRGRAGRLCARPAELLAHRARGHHGVRTAGTHQGREPMTTSTSRPGGRDAGAGGHLHPHRAAAGQLDPAGPAQDRRRQAGRPPQFVTVAVDKAGQAFFNDKPVNAAELSVALQQAKLDPDTEVQLRADQGVPYGRVVEVMGEAQKAGLNRIGFVAEAPAQRPAPRPSPPHRRLPRRADPRRHGRARLQPASKALAAMFR